MDFKQLAATASAAAKTAPSGALNKAAPAELDFAVLFAKLKEEACKTPEQRAREKILEKHNLDEQGYRNLSADKRAAIDLEITQEIRRVAEQRRAGMAARNGALV